MTFDEDEGYKIDRAAAALLMGIPPRKVDEEPLEDVLYVLAVHGAQQELQNRPLRRR